MCSLQLLSGPLANPAVRRFNLFSRVNTGPLFAVSASAVSFPAWHIDRLGLGDLHSKVQLGERLSFEDGLRLYRCPDLNAVGYLANLVRERRNGGLTYYVRNQHINYTNICNKFCKFCSFYALPKDPRAYTLSLEDVRQRVRDFLDHPVSEIHMVAGINPKLEYSYYLGLIRVVKETRPGVHVKAFTMVELDQIARKARKPLEETLLELKAAGLDSIPGGGAEVFSDRIHQELYPLKQDGGRWLEIARTAHRVGLHSNATMLYGHIERVEEKVQHLLRLREAQDETGGFYTYIPLSFHPEKTELEQLPHATGEQDLREIAVGRLLLDNFPHVKAFWVMITPAVAQVAQWYGADDIDGTIVEYEITRDPVTDTKQFLTHDQLLHLIREAGREPFERDARYERVKWNST
ncbi:MAG: aminofutalosine synthase MqnE [Planctomycetes bacterium]|nr:aminofutalosine synthase MqnE [Planctomycetota bacterium]